MRDIRRLRAEGLYLRELAEMFGVRIYTIELIVKRRSWKHVA